MQTLPEEFEEGALVCALAEGWGIGVRTVEYAAVGAGSYHWIAIDPNGTRLFVTVDDLDNKVYLGDTRERVFEALRGALETAVALRDRGLDFVVAPIPTTGGEAVRRVGSRHTVAVYPFVDGQVSAFGRHEASARGPIVAMLAELHRATPAVRSTARAIGLGLSGRGRIESAMREVDRPWRGGPFSEPARRVLAAHVADVSALLTLADRLVAEVTRRGSPWVVTHGEPHAANVMRVSGRPLLIDWDTLALAPPERDLWMLVEDSGNEAAAYVELTGRRLDNDAIRFFRLAWDLNDLTEYLAVLRAPHRRTEDTEQAYEAVARCVAIRDR
jgi:spectinomycin phosphotransferase